MINFKGKIKIMLILMLMGVLIVFSVFIYGEEPQVKETTNKVELYMLLEGLRDVSSYQSFAPLFYKSYRLEDFAYGCVQNSYLEDFACTVQYYKMHTKDEFLKVCKGERSVVYLEKLLYVLEVFTTGHPGYTMVYSSGDTSSNKAVNVGRDAKGKIISISGVDIYKSGVDIYMPDLDEKSYNLEGLKGFFEDLVF